MPPVGKTKRKAKGDASDVTSELVSDELDSLSTLVGQRVRRADSDSSASEAGTTDRPKKYKSEKAAAAAAAVAATAAAVGAGDCAANMDTDPDISAAVSGVAFAVPVAAAPRESRPRKKSTPSELRGSVTLADLRKVTDSLYDAAFGLGLSFSAVKCIVDHGGKYEDLVMRLMLENEGLKGRLEGLQSAAMAPISNTAAVTNAAPAVGARAAPATHAVPAAPFTKPVETWSVVVRGKGGASSKEVANKVVEQVGPTLGVRVHELKPMRGGGVVLRTPSVAERQKVAANKRFEEVGLEVSINDKLGPRVVVRGVHAEITSDEFMTQLFEMNLKEKMTMEVFRKCVRLVSSPWKPDAGPQNVILEGSERAMNYLLNVGRVYVKWFSFMVRPRDEVAHCFRCLGFDHRLRDCRMKEAVCRICSQGGHESWQCQGRPYCRNCAFKGLPADHTMMSSACPTYAVLVARANARH